MCLASFTHCTASSQINSLEFDLSFIESFLTKCSTQLDLLRGRTESACNSTGVISFDKFRYLLTEIQNLILSKGFSTCFYCDIKTVVHSEDYELLDDVEFLTFVSRYFNELKYVLENDKKELKVSLIYVFYLFIFATD